jgi:hypothetical protein
MSAVKKKSWYVGMKRRSKPEMRAQNHLVGIEYQREVAF